MGGTDMDHSGSEKGAGRLPRLLFTALMVGMTALTVWAIVGALGDSEPAGAAQAASSKDSSGGSGGQAPAVDPVPEGCPPSADACINTKLRISWLQHDGKITYGPVPIMPGASGKWETPQGSYQVEWKAPDFVSSEFDEPMPNSVFFAPGGIAFHQGPLAQVSHGCVHLSKQAAQYYFDNLPVGAKVVSFGGYPPES